MPFASLSAEVRAKKLMQDLGLRQSFVAAICDVGESQLSKAFRGMRELSNEEGLRLITTLTRLAALRDALSPLAIDFRDPRAAQGVLDAFYGFSAEEIHRKVTKNSCAGQSFGSGPIPDKAKAFQKL